jgi:hypothetical protein
MRTVNLLLGNSERALSQLIETVVLDACYNQAAVECIRAVRMEDFVRLGSGAGFQLIIVVVGNLLPAASRRGSQASFEDTLDAVRTIRQRAGTPIITFSTQKEHEVPLLEAGAEAVISLPFKGHTLNTEVRRILRLPEPVEHSAPVRWTLAGALLRGWQRLRSA